jgi:hypothetical protein
MRRTLIAAVAAVAASLSLHAAIGAAHDAEVRKAKPLSEVQSLYLQHCGGCHGIQGVSAPREIPDLRGQAGFFLCSDEGRAYLIRLPNIALAPVSDQLLTELMNFVMFELGGARTLAARPRAYTAAEVGRLRKEPLTNTGLSEYRARLVKDLIKRCGAPESLNTYSVATVQ